MEPEEFDLLAEVARRRGASVSDLMREAARAQLLSGVAREARTAAARAFLSLPDAKLPPWGELKREIEGRFE